MRGVAGCHIGPAYHPPVIQPPPAFKEAPPATPPADTAQSQNNPDNGNWTVAQPADAKIRGDWWNVFNDPELDDLERQLNIDNQNLKLYFENFMEARALVREARAQYFPTVSIGPVLQPSAFLWKPWQAPPAWPTREKSRRSTPCRWMFPGLRISLAESAMKCAMRNSTPNPALRIWRTNACVEQADLAEYFFEIRGQDALIEIYTQTVAADQKALDYNQAQYDTGVGDQLSLVEARATLQAAQSSLTNLGILRAQYEHAIAVLIGKPASGFSLPTRPILTAPPPVPVGMPSLLLAAPARRCRSRANHGCGQRGTGRCLYCFLPRPYPLCGWRI